MCVTVSLCVLVKCTCWGGKKMLMRPSGGSSTVTYSLVFDMRRVGSTSYPLEPPPLFLLCGSNVKAGIKFLSTSSGWGTGHTCAGCTPRTCRRVAVFPKHGTPQCSFCSFTCFFSHVLFPSLLHPDCLFKMMVPLAGLWFTKNK